MAWDVRHRSQRAIVFPPPSLCHFPHVPSMITHIKEGHLSHSAKKDKLARKLLAFVWDLHARQGL